jgi:NAD(P)-dependent dehydrogenase (short-subunit alcohol dehydrogenase family)
MRVCTLARPKLAERRGCIVNMASMLAFFGGGLVPAYSASKGGVAQLTKSLAIAYAPDGIRVNAVAPGFFPTKMTRDVLAAAEKQIARVVPMGRVGGDTELMGAAVFLLSPAAAYVTGQVLAVDGGMAAA